MSEKKEKLASEAATSEKALEEMGYKQELKRALTVPDMIVYGLIFMVPIAPFGIYGDVFTGSNGMPALVYLIGMVAMVFTAFSYAALSEAFPVSGSVYGYVSRGINKHLGFFGGWMILLDYLLVPTLLYVVAAQAMSGIVPEVPAIVWGLLFIAINTFINIRGITLTAIIDKVALVLELLVLAIFVIMGIYFIANSADLSFTIKPFYNSDGFSLNLVMSAVSLGVLSFLGFDGISTLSEEAEDAKQGPKKATLVALFVVGIFFMLQTYIAGCLDPTGASFADDPGNAFYWVANIAGGNFLYILCALATAIAWGIFNSLAAQTALTRVLFAMGRDKMLPAPLAKVHPKWKTPYIAVIFVAVASVILFLVFNGLGIAAISKLVNFGALTAFMLLDITVIWYFFIKQKTHKVVKHLILPLVGFLIIGYVWLSLDPASKIMGISWIAIGIVYYLVLYFGFRRKDAEIEL